MKRLILFIVFVCASLIYGQAKDSYYISSIVDSGNVAMIPFTAPLNGYYLSGIVWSDSSQTADTVYFKSALNSTSDARWLNNYATGTRIFAVIPTVDIITSVTYLPESVFSGTGYCYPVLDAAVDTTRNYFLIYSR